MNLERLSARTEGLQEYAIEILRKLVQVSTVNPPGSNYAKALEIVANEFKAFSWNTESVTTPDSYISQFSGKNTESRGERVNLIASNSAKSKIILNAHIDTVPVGAGWSKDPFAGTFEDGLLYGRGAADDKSGVVLLVLVGRLLKELSISSPDPVFTVTVDEEIGGHAGMGYLIKSRKVGGRGLLCADGRIDFIAAYHNGVYRFKINVVGRSVHASRPFKGLNAIEAASKLILRFQNYGQELLKKRSLYDGPPDLVSEGISELYPTLNVGVIRGGIKSNVVPDGCEIELERRFLPEEDVSKVKDDIASIVKEVSTDNPQFKFLLEEGDVHDSAFTDPNDPFVLGLQNAIEKTLRFRVPIVWFGWGN